MKHHSALLTFMALIIMTFTPPAAYAGSLLAGAAKVELNTPEGISLAGFAGGKRRHLSPQKQNPYAHYLTASKGVHDPVFAKTLFLKSGTQNLIVVGLDLIAAPREFRKDLAQRLQIYGITEQEIIVTATHTHSGPGCVAQSLFWQILAADRFVGKVYNQFIDDITQSLLTAMAELRPAHLGVQTFLAENFTKNRRDNPLSLDPTGTLVKVVDLEGSNIGTILNFPIHGTVMGTDNLMMSADIPGAMANELESRTGGVVVFVNGAEGDVSPVVDGRNFQGMQLTAQKFADQVYPLWTTTSVSPEVQMHLTEKEVPLGTPKFNVMACAKQKSGSFLPKLPSQRLGLPTKAVLGVITLNNHAFVTVPGEPITDLGLQLKQLGANAGFATTSIFGLANDHLAYILTEKEYLRGGYEACGSFYGKKMGDKIAHGVAELFGQQ